MTANGPTSWESNWGLAAWGICGHMVCAPLDAFTSPAELPFPFLKIVFQAFFMPLFHIESGERQETWGKRVLRGLAAKGICDHVVCALITRLLWFLLCLITSIKLYIFQERSVNETLNPLSSVAMSLAKYILYFIQTRLILHENNMLEEISQNDLCSLYFCVTLWSQNVSVWLVNG